MKKIFHITIIFLFIGISAFSQNDSIESLVKKASSVNYSMSELTDFAKQNINKKKDLAKFFYYWVGSNIQYDEITLQNVLNGEISNEEFNNLQSIENVFETRKGVCAGYAQLYKWFMNQMGIEVYVVTGYIRDERNHYVELELDDNSRHAWNVIKLDGTWIILDSTWGTSQDSTVSNFYFDMKPELAIITHFPEQEKWQLLEKPLSLSEFNNSKFIKPVWFHVGFTDIPSLKEDSQYYYFVYRSNPDKEWSTLWMYSLENGNYTIIRNTTRIDQDGFTYIRFEKTQVPEKAFYKMQLNRFNTEESTSTSIFNVFYFKT